jgi:Guanylate-binding protein, C-terminal domain
LENLETDALRPDFVNQMLNLRKKIMDRTKIKTLNGKALDGGMLGSLLSNYVEAINKGAVPNIENAWTYICRNQTQQALDNCF